MRRNTTARRTKPARRTLAVPQPRTAILTPPLSVLFTAQLRATLHLPHMFRLAGTDIRAKAPILVEPSKRTTAMRTFAVSAIRKEQVWLVQISE
jgi:hypothetical protein